MRAVRWVALPALLLAGAARAELDADRAGAWVRPVDAISLRAQGFEEHDRGYSTAARPRNIAGDVGWSCELQEGRACGGGAGAMAEVDSAAGLGGAVVAATRLRIDLGNHQYEPAVQVDRAYVRAQVGLFGVEAGRDVLSLGPSPRGALLVSRNAAPMDQVRAWVRPFSLPFLDPEALRVSLLYFIARLRQPQARDGAFVDCTRMQLDLFHGRLALGGSRLLQFGGSGAPAVDLGDFVVEHFVRKYDAGGRPLGDNRLAFDAAVSLPELAGTRLYTEATFEDFRSEELNVLRYDTDYLLGADVRALEVGPLRRVFVELAKTGRISQEGLYWLTGWTNAGRTLGSPLGPDGLSLYARAELETPVGPVAPWVEALRFSSDVFTADAGGNAQIAARGPVERRERAGLDLAVPVRPAVLLEAGAYVERVVNADFEPGSSRVNGGARVAISWTPGESATF